MAGLLFARAGCNVRVLEKHADFFRDFRGDTVHPSTMEILDQLGMLERFLDGRTTGSTSAELRLAGREWTIGDLSHLDTPAPFIAMMPQWDFLDFLRDEAKAFPGFQLEMEAPVDRLHRGAGQGRRRPARGRPRAARAADHRRRRPRVDRPHHASGRGSRRADGRVLVPPRQSRAETSGGLRGNVERGRLLVLIDRGDYWQCAFLIPKGAAEEYQARGIAAIREEVAAAAPRARPRRARRDRRPPSADASSSTG